MVFFVLFSKNYVWIKVIIIIEYIQSWFVDSYDDSVK